MPKVHIVLYHDRPWKVFSSKQRALASMINLSTSQGFKIDPEALNLSLGVYLVDTDGRATNLALRTMDVE